MRVGKQMKKKVRHNWQRPDVVWTEEEEKGIEACKGGRAKTREMNRLLHNRYAAEQGQHVLAPVSGANMKCALCGEEAEWRRILQWPKTKCKKGRKKETGRSVADEGERRR